MGQFKNKSRLGQSNYLITNDWDNRITDVELQESIGTIELR